MGAAHAWAAAEGSLRNRAARCYDDGFTPSARFVFRNTKRAALRVSRRGQDVEEDAGGSAGGGVREMCGDWRAASGAEFAGVPGDIRAVENKDEEQYETEGQHKTEEAAVIIFHIPGPLRSFSGGRSEVELKAQAGTVSEALQALWAVCPGMR